MKYALLTLLGLALGLFMVLLLPAILGTYLADWWQSATGTPHVRAGGEGDLSPTEEASACPHGVRDADNCLMCAIEKPDDEPDATGLTKAIMRNEWVNSVELWLEAQKGKKNK
jgi:hypothetical protein